MRHVTTIWQHKNAPVTNTLGGVRLGASTFLRNYNINDVCCMCEKFIINLLVL